MGNELILKGGTLLLILSGVPLLIAAAVSFICSMIQSVLQLQDQTLPYVVRVGTLFLILYTVGGWGGRAFIHFFQDCLMSIALVGS